MDFFYLWYIQTWCYASTGSLVAKMICQHSHDDHKHQQYQLFVAAKYTLAVKRVMRPSQLENRQRPCLNNNKISKSGVPNSPKYTEYFGNSFHLALLIGFFIHQWSKFMKIIHILKMPDYFIWWCWQYYNADMETRSMMQFK